MIVIDTNVLSELARRYPDERVIAWFGTQAVGDLWSTAITEAEMLVGVAIMPEGRRKIELGRAIDSVIMRFEHRILPFDREAARYLPNVHLRRLTAKLEPKLADSQIAAIALAHGASVATRDVGDFEHTGIKVINPWTA